MVEAIGATDGSINEADPGDNTPPDAPAPDSGSGATVEPLTLDALASEHIEGMAGFDPAIHAVNPDGSPKRKTDGTFARKRGRKAGATARPWAGGATAEAGQVSAECEPVNYKAIAQTAVGASLGIAVMTLGDEWRPRDKAEFTGLVDATALYMETAGVKDIPPGWLLLATVSAYALPRLTQPTTKSRLVNAWLKIKGFFGKKSKPLAGEK